MLRTQRHIAIVGTGYVGLVTGTCLAEAGHVVTCIDIDREKIKKLQRGKLTIYEPGLETIFKRNRTEKRLRFTTKLNEAVKETSIIYLALPTPAGKDGSADLSFIISAAQELGAHIKNYKIIINKSTVPVGTAELVREIISMNTTANYDVVSNPEFLREGFAVEDFMKPGRIVIGTSSEKAKKILMELYSPFVRQGNPIIIMDERSAEMTKYATNSYLASRISFMNEVANLCEKIGADVDLVRKGMGTDERIGNHFLYPGIGYGGSCFPKDVKAMIKMGERNELRFKILEAVEMINENQKNILIEKINSYYKEGLSGKKFAIWGLSFKPNTDDIREAPSLTIINKLLEEGAQVSVYDPEAMENVKRLYEGINFGKDQYSILKGADALIITTEWSLFRTPNFKKMSQLMKSKNIFDGRNLFAPKTIEKTGFYYESIGRKKVNVPLMISQPIYNKPDKFNKIKKAV